jgi:6-phosphogluconolactonase
MKRLFAAAVIITLAFACFVSNAQNTEELLIGTYTRMGGSHGIYVARFDMQTGALQLVDSLAGENPSYLALNKGNDRLYSVNENNGGSVRSFTLNRTTGKWAPLNAEPVPTRGMNPCYISIDSKGRHLMVANYSSGSLTALPIDNNGMVKPATQVIQHVGKSVNAERQGEAHCHTAIFAPSEKYVVTADLGTDMVQAYGYNPKNEMPLDTAKVVAIKVAAGAGPRHIAFHPKLQVFYVMEELSGNVTVHGFRKKIIALLQTIKGDTVSKKPGSADIHVSPDGRFLYASHRADANMISIYQIDEKSGRLTQTGATSTMGNTPRNFTIHPSGNWLLAANQNSDNIVVFRRDAATGVLTDTGHRLRVKQPVCLVFRPLQGK